MRFRQGSGSAVLAPRRRGGRSRREAWGGGFGEGGERGSSEELLPSLTATQRPTSFYYFYFLSGLLTFKMHDFCADRRLHPHQSAETFLEGPASPDFQHCCPSLWPHFPTFPLQWLSLHPFLSPWSGRGVFSRVKALFLPLLSPQTTQQMLLCQELGHRILESKHIPCLSFLIYKMGIKKVG